MTDSPAPSRGAAVVLALAALMFGGFGALLVSNPELLDHWLDIKAGTEGRTELRAFFGGMELGLAVFLLACASKPAWRGVGCLAVALLCGGTAAGRVYGFFADHSFTWKLAGFLAVEVLFVVLALAVRRGNRT